MSGVDLIFFHSLPKGTVYSAYLLWNAQDDHQAEFERLLKFGSSGLPCKKPVLKKKKNSGAHYQQIWEILEYRFDGQGERFTHRKHYSMTILKNLDVTLRKRNS